MDSARETKASSSSTHPGRRRFSAMHDRSSFHAAVLVLAAGQPWASCDLAGSGTKYSAGSRYEKNLMHLVEVLRANASSSPALFASGAFGADPDTVYGLVLCRGDVSVSDCYNCGIRTLEHAAGACQRSRAVALCYNQCYFRISDADFLDSTNYYYANMTMTLVSGESVPISDISGFSIALSELLNATTQYAVKNTTRLFATGKWTGPDTRFPQIYSMAQCAPDLSPELCDLCLQELLHKQRDGVKLGTTGARILVARCNLRYEMSPDAFYTGDVMVQLPIQIAASAQGTAKGTSNSNNKTLAIILSTVVAALAAISLCICCVRRKIRWPRSGRLPLRHFAAAGHHTPYDLETIKSCLLSLSSIQTATNNFDESTKLGEGGFGGVYKGILTSGQEVAVKRLSKGSNQGIEEVKNELVLVAKLHHKNLVQLVGFCLEGEERLLVYEYMANKSLDTILFDPEEKGRLDWAKRFSVIEGVARGVQYLHEDSQMKIIHRDLKASDVLLDASTNPKIGDFGLARLFGQDQTRDVTSHIAGTFGYMSREYVMCGRYSTKSDVFSFDILVVEIVTGLRNNGSYFAEQNKDVISIVWRHWVEGTVTEMIDDSLGRRYPRAQVIRCLNIGLLCLQQNPLDRPTMSEIMIMLDNNNDGTSSLPAPAKPTFFMDGTSGYSRSSGNITRSYVQ